MGALRMAVDCDGACQWQVLYRASARARGSDSGCRVTTSGNRAQDLVTPIAVAASVTARLEAVGFRAGALDEARLTAALAFNVGERLREDRPEVGAFALSGEDQVRAAGCPAADYRSA